MIQNLREITIGRDKNSDIYLDESCKLEVAIMLLSSTTGIN